MLLIAGAIGSMAHLGSGDPSLPLVLGAMAGVGAGLALTYPAASILAINSAPDRVRGTTAAVLTTAQNVGGSAGLALVTALALVPRAGPAGSLAVPMTVCALLVVAGLAVGLHVLLPRRDPRQPDRVVMRELGL